MAGGADLLGLGMHLQAPRADADAAVDGALDFGALFGGLSGFLIVSALLLVALLAVFGMEARAAQIGVLGASVLISVVAVGVLGSNVSGNISTGAIFWLAVTFVLRATFLSLPTRVRAPRLDDGRVHEPRFGPFGGPGIPARSADSGRG